jgi:phosphatidylglycerophosphate synthase
MEAPRDSSAPGDRRPLRTRETAFAKRTASWISARGVSPNAISVAGMFAGVAGGIALAATAHWPDAARPMWLAGAGLVQLRLLCNMLDGMVAVATRTTSPVGEIYNEVPDRVSDAATLVGLGYAVGGAPWVGWAAAVLAMFTAYVRAVGKSAGAGSRFEGPMAKPQRMFLVTLAALWSGLTPASWQPAGSHGVATWALALIAFGSAITGARRLAALHEILRRSPT